jgi:hypothetical protein
MVVTERPAAGGHDSSVAQPLKKMIIQRMIDRPGTGEPTIYLRRPRTGVITARVATVTLSNYSCPACSAKLLKRQRGEPAKPGEQAFCPHCMTQLSARDGPYTLGYELVEAPPRDPWKETQRSRTR